MAGPAMIPSAAEVGFDPEEARRQERDEALRLMLEGAGRRMAPFAPIAEAYQQYIGQPFARAASRYLAGPPGPPVVSAENEVGYRGGVRPGASPDEAVNVSDPGAQGIPPPLPAQPVTKTTSTYSKQTGGGAQSLPTFQEEMRGLSESEANAVAAMGSARSAGLAAEAKTLEAAQKIADAREAQYRRDLSGELAKRAVAEDEYAKIRADVATLKLDPDRYWSNAATGQKVSLAIGAALSQFGDALLKRNGPNAVLQMIERAIDRDIDAQKTNIAMKRARLGDARGVLADLNARIGDMRMSEIQARAMYWDGIKRKTDIIAKTTQSSTVAANAQNLSAQIAQKSLIQRNAAWQEEHRIPVVQSGGTKVTVSGGPSGGELKRLPPKEIKDMVKSYVKVRDWEKMAYKIRDKKLDPMRELLGVFGTDAGLWMPKVRALARQMGRATGTDVGNFAQQEGAIMVEAMTSKNWDKARNSFNTIMGYVRDAKEQHNLTIGAYQGQRYETAGLPRFQAR